MLYKQHERKAETVNNPRNNLHKRALCALLLAFSGAFGLHQREGQPITRGIDLVTIPQQMRSTGERLTIDAR